MALWRDPLEELIGELERTLPAQAPADLDMPPSFDCVVFAVNAILHATTAEDRARAEQDPHVQAIHAYYARHPLRLARDRTGGNGDKNA